MRLYHRTTRESADAILADGFRDTTGTYGTGREFSGVWLSDRPLDVHEGAIGDVLLAVDGLPDATFAHYEWVEDHKSFREALVPAAMVNAASVKEVDEWEEFDRLEGGGTT